MADRFVYYAFVESIGNAVGTDSWKSDSLLDTEEELAASLSFVAGDSGDVAACVSAKKIREAIESRIDTEKLASFSWYIVSEKRMIQFDSKPRHELTMLKWTSKGREHRVDHMKGIHVPAP